MLSKLALFTERGLNFNILFCHSNKRVDLNKYTSTLHTSLNILAELVESVEVGSSLYRYGYHIGPGRARTGGFKSGQALGVSHGSSMFVSYLGHRAGYL